VAKVAQSATATWPRNMPTRLSSGPRDYFKTNFFLQGCNSNFFFHRDEIQNGPKLQGLLSYLSQKK